jgi:hypothetical protein
MPSSHGNGGIYDMGTRSPGRVFKPLNIVTACQYHTGDGAPSKPPTGRSNPGAQFLWDTTHKHGRPAPILSVDQERYQTSVQSKVRRQSHIWSGAVRYRTRTGAEPVRSGNLPFQKNATYLFS